MAAIRFVEDLEQDGVVWKSFQVLSISTLHPQVAQAVALGYPMGEANPLKDLDASCELALLSNFRDAIAEHRKAGEQFLFVIDLTHFPYLHCRIRTDDPFPGDDSAFDRDIRRLWKENHPTRVLTILVNAHRSFSGLKHIHFRTDK